MTLLELARQEGKAKVAIAARVNGVVTDLARPLPDGAQVEWVLPSDPDGVEILRHSTAHVLAAAVKDLFPGGRRSNGSFRRTRTGWRSSATARRT